MNVDERLALALYTYDLKSSGEKEENFYHILNKVIRHRNDDEMMCWRGYLYYFFAALKKIVNVETTVYR